MMLQLRWVLRLEATQHHMDMIVKSTLEIRKRVVPDQNLDYMDTISQSSDILAVDTRDCGGAEELIISA